MREIRGGKKGVRRRREEERVRCAGTRVGTLSDLTVGHATRPGRSYLAAMEGILCRIMDSGGVHTTQRRLHDGSASRRAAPVLGNE